MGVSPSGTGWLPPLPDLRDYTVEQPEIAKMSETMGLPGERQKKPKALPPTANLRPWCSPIENQKNLRLLHGERRRGGRRVLRAPRLRQAPRRVSPLHLQDHAQPDAGDRRHRRLAAHHDGSAGALRRPAREVLALRGARLRQGADRPSSTRWRTTTKRCEYFCHDPLGGERSRRRRCLASVKYYLAAGIPSMFGFWGFPSFNYVRHQGRDPLSVSRRAGPQWGHAIVAVGYDDGKQDQEHGVQQDHDGRPAHPQLLGHDLGRPGLWVAASIDYVLNKLALDFWSLLSQGWVDTGEVQHLTESARGGDAVLKRVSPALAPCAPADALKGI